MVLIALGIVPTSMQAHLCCVVSLLATMPCCSLPTPFTARQRVKWIALLLARKSSPFTVVLSSFITQTSSVPLDAFSGLASSSLLWVFHLQGVVTYMSPVEAFATGIKIFVCLIAWFFTGQRSICSHAFLILWFSQFGGHLDPLIGSQKGLWSLDSIFIPVANASTRDI